jgi:membrane protease YdiL (CAAX protease family)
MTFPTLTPEVRAYCVALVVVFSLAATSLASKLQGPSRWNVGRPRFRLAHIALLAAVASLAVAILGVPRFVPDSPMALAGVICAGIALGVVAVIADRAIVRLAGPSGRVRLRHKISASALLLGVLAAVLEEIVYRGYLISLCSEIPNTALYTVALSSTVLAFAAAHIYSGPAQALAKLPLGLLAIAAVLISGALLPAIVAHVLFNLLSTEEPSREREQVDRALTRVTL